MITMIYELLSYSFIQRALISGILIAIACSVLGIFLVLRKHAFIGEGLAHISFGGIALGLFLGINPVIAALILTILGGIGITKLRESAKLNSDNAVGIFSYAGFALGIVLISVSKGFNADLFSYLFGNILAISMFDVVFSAALSLLIISFVFLFYNELAFVTFDEQTAKTSGVNVKLINYMLGILVAITVVISMRIVGIILVASFMIIPASASLQLSSNFRQSIFISA
ncbi:metal ABC transporter permease, partial [Candidatus Woesearchaeota archaeon]|nr:metal ABC transporter permease [Candidatus Woesearchaeota archaeon]